MGNYFLKVDKSLFNLGLNPLEILLISQITEFQTNTGDCFISDKVLAENFGVSESTITRTLKNLETKGLIRRITKNVKGGKERHMQVDHNKLVELATSKMPVDSGEQAAKCLLTTSKMIVDNKQNDLIKDNLKDKGIDNKGELEQPTAVLTLQELPQGDSSTIGQEEREIEIDGIKAVDMDRAAAVDKYGLSACVSRIPTAFPGCFWIGDDLVRLKK